MLARGKIAIRLEVKHHVVSMQQSSDMLDLTKVDHQAGLSIKLNPHLLAFAVHFFHCSSLQGILQFGRLDAFYYL